MALNAGRIITAADSLGAAQAMINKAEICYQSTSKVKINLKSNNFNGEYLENFEGVINNLERRHNNTKSSHAREWIQQYMAVQDCFKCSGFRLKPEHLFYIDAIGMDWETMKNAHNVLHTLGVEHECRIVSAHRTPDRMVEYAKTAKDRGIKVIIAGAGGAAHLPGMVASMTPLPVLGVPVKSKALKGMDSLLSIAQMPGGVPVGTLAIGDAGAKNAGILAASIIGAFDEKIMSALEEYRQAQTDSVAEIPKD